MENSWQKALDLNASKSRFSMRARLLKQRRPPAFGDWIRRIRTKQQGVQAIARAGLPHQPKRFFSLEQQQKLFRHAGQLFSSGAAPNGIDIVAIPSDGNYSVESPVSFKRIFGLPRRVWVKEAETGKAVKELAEKGKKLSGKQKKVTFMVAPSMPSKGLNVFRIFIADAEVNIDFSGGRFPRKGEQHWGKPKRFTYQMKMNNLKAAGEKPSGLYKEVVPKLLSHCSKLDFPNNTVLEGYVSGGKIFFWEMYPTRQIPPTLPALQRAFHSREYHARYNRYYNQEGD